ncbi:MAG TPA: GH116 family glycosyl hydrolase [Gemmatimonadaceae bacterium]|nr:GH116 family glycosyl hydrolase [Gemmatimonadaceae bacterium]
MIVPRFLALSLVGASLLRAQTRGTIPEFSLGGSAITLHGDARPNVFLSAVGRRSIAMGTEDGRFELWTWPIKWLHDLQLSFRVPKYTTPIPGRDVARWITSRPEGVTITYAYETFTVKQHVFAPLDLPAIVMLLEVDAVRPMEIVATFTPDVHYAWPASLGGQYVAWNPDARAFLFSESRRKVNAFLGSPAVTKASDVPAHMLSAAPPQLVLGVGDASQQYTEPKLGEPPGGNVNLHVGYIPIVLVGGEMPRDSVRAIYQRLLGPGAIEREWRRRRAHADSLLNQSLGVETPDTTLNRAFAWAKVNLDESMVCNPDLGCGLVAGYGLAGAASDRPGFGWFFGGDAAINSFAMSALGGPYRDLVRQGVFRFYAKYQRADGKITHEISQGAGKIDWFGAYPYAFYHGDTTPFWILALGEYFAQSADTALVRELWPNLRRAFEWSRKADSDDDGLMENPIAGAGALEVGDLQVGIVSDVYLSGVWIAALQRFARIAEVLGEATLARDAVQLRSRALATLEQKLWLPSLGQYAFALLEGGRVNENLTAWPATAMSFDVFNRGRGAQMAVRLASSEIMTDWGARPLAASSTLFDPLHYNNGAVWPFVTGWVALALYRYGNPSAGYFALSAIARTTFDESRGRNPEVISGRVYKPLDTAVPQQFFATSMIVTPAVRGLLGIEVDAVNGKLTLAPQLPPSWDRVMVRNVAVGGATVDAEITQVPGRISAAITLHGRQPIVVSFRPRLPLGARPASDSSSRTLRDSATLEVRFDGGWQAEAPAEVARIGERSRAARVVNEALEADGSYRVTLEGRAGSSARFVAYGPVKQAATVSAGSIVADVARGKGNSDGTSWIVTFPSSDRNADGYVTIEARMSASGR